MRKFLSLFAAILFAGSMMAAETVVYTLMYSNAAGGGNAYATNYDVTVNGIGWNVPGNTTMNPARIGGKSLSKEDRVLYSKIPIENNISKIEIEHGTASGITVHSMTVIVASNAEFSNVISTLTPAFAANATVTAARPDGADWSNAYYKIIYNVSVTSTSSNKYIEFKGAKFYAEGGDDTPPITQDEIKLDVVYAEAGYYSDYTAWYLNLYKDYDTETEEITYPDVYIGFYAKSATALAGTYSADDDLIYATAYFAEKDSVDAASYTDMVITHKGNGVYTVKLRFVGEDAKTYVIDWEGQIYAYDADTWEDIELNEDGGETPPVSGDLATSGVHTLKPVEATSLTSGANTGLDIILDGIHLAWEGAYYNSDEKDFRVYASKKMSITAGAKIVKVEIAGYTKAGQTISVDKGDVTTGASYEGETTKSDIADPLVVIENIDATSVTITCTKQLRAQLIRVTLDSVTAIDNADAAMKATKVLENGTLFIKRGNKTYHVTGTLVR